MMREVTAIAHGKVNLHLGVGALRDDGYHELVSIFQSLELRDVVTLTEASPNTGVAGRVVGLECATAGVPTDNTNLAWRAVDIVFGRSTQQPPAVRIAIAKGIPTAGGMAGGSADAAAALIAANKILDNEFELGELLDIAADLGSDVPFTLVGGTALGTGRGEHLVPTLSKGTYHWALAFSRTGLATPAVFRKLDELGHTPHLDVTALSRALRTGNPHQVAPLLHNDMQAAALSLQPQLRTTLNTGMAAGALAGIVSGSGPTCAFLCEDARAAREVAAELSLSGNTAVTSGPARGAHLKGE